MSKKIVQKIINNDSDCSDNESDAVSNESEQETQQINKKVVDDSDNSNSEIESDYDDKEKKVKEKKQKESFEQLTKKLETLRSDIKDINKDINDLEKQLKNKEKIRNDFERQVNNIVKILSKTHIDEINKALKSKPKRKGNINGGFNKEQPVPEILRKFIGLPEGAAMPRPKVMSALNNKFCELKLKNGQITKLDKDTAKSLGLGKEGDGKEIKFTEFQSFLASFYPKKETKIEA